MANTRRKSSPGKTPEGSSRAKGNRAASAKKTKHTRMDDDNEESANKETRGGMEVSDGIENENEKQSGGKPSSTTNEHKEQELESDSVEIPSVLLSRETASDSYVIVEEKQCKCTLGSSFRLAHS